MVSHDEDYKGPHMERNISALTANTIALVLAGGRGSRLKALTDWRAKPAVPFGGKFRIIDFLLSKLMIFFYILMKKKLL